MKKLLRTGAAGAAALVSAVAMTTSIFAATPNSSSISGTGPDSDNHVTTHSRTTNRVHNYNHVWLHNGLRQEAESGDAGVYHNTTGGSARSGSAANSSATSTKMSVSNTSSSKLSSSSGNLATNSKISNTGPDSDNSIRTTQKTTNTVENTNKVAVDNWVSQEAESGDATVAGNTTGGSATSGNASNTSSNSTTISIGN
ncbi:MAG TPA: hypothetical protein VFK03_01730 [Candidatus Saccharimonadales bacterium]|nr:hypothetical protein [Candidatus Saccharimonadales bacterium]